MITIEKIEEAIHNASWLQSKSGASTYDVPALSSLRLRHLMNNLGAMSSIYLECGPHKGGLFSATVAGHYLTAATAVDSFESDMDATEPARPIFLKNVKKHFRGRYFDLVESDCFKVDLDKIHSPVDLYLYDAGHSEEEQRMALTYYLPVLADEFIFCVDDYDWPEVKKGTQDGIKECGLDVAFEHTLVGNNHDNDGWWNGFYVALLRKKTKS